MLKILLGLCLFLGLIVLWKIFFKIQINQHTQQFRIKQLTDLIKPDATSAQSLSTPKARVDEVEEYEQQLFDDVCQIFFERHLTERNLSQAIVVQEGILKKLPAKAQTRIRKLDLGEWSIYWTFYDQSLEYYVGRYGVFYTHIDRFGCEHKCEFKEQPNRV
ncbi:hypothetical protein [Acinetobacter sp.]|uniref:hypothetical protein n=1 Tax=Acinetobacter sp. TaxID=472 RepID=UPI002647F255|nr:hypothetical protein [Acinetobacter sp.]MDN5511616.1 hypothetical protein [Acinetobacter sp.]MDN5524530.1 hypothetical protein [Acinetobacter sp.]